MREALLQAEFVERLASLGIVARMTGDGVIVGNDAGGEALVRIVDAGTGAPRAVANALLRQGEQKYTFVLVADHFGRQATGVLGDSRTSYMDDQVLDLRIPNLGLRVRAERAQRAVPLARGRVQLSGAAGAVVLALLHSPNREWKVTDLADFSRVSAGTAHTVLVALEAEGLVAGSGSGPLRRRVLVDKSTLLDRYARDAAKDRRVVGSGYVLDEGPEVTLRTIQARLDGAEDAPRGIGLVFTGVAAAQLLAPHLTEVTRYEAWVTTPHRTDYVLRAMGAQDVVSGSNLTLLSGGLNRLWPHDTSAMPVTVAPVASVFRIYADLLADSLRGEEQAEYFRRTVIGF
ncbi:MAG: hypothetical protein Q8S43_10580 [Actinomycetota bacterium]|nr:MAG: hypothetical protein FD171_1543 [Actinomycetota bacterium]MDP3631378.1 hypothetical protein [Actinomycetota bacterium]